MNDEDDILGVVVVEGDFIAYGQRSGNSGCLSLGRVVEVDGGRIKVQGYSKYRGKFEKNSRTGWTLASRVLVLDRMVKLNAMGAMGF